MLQFRGGYVGVGILVQKDWNRDAKVEAQIRLLDLEVKLCRFSVFLFSSILCQISTVRVSCVVETWEQVC
ncbi:unnamed protein product [Linum tenue]|uniref:Uncharacterized protein n=1 Tax=Linum tenue TaxID=586396 RepID=A0AAV0PV05_9ROSI|nr:unnamed protein product [Linum tenue]